MYLTDKKNNIIRELDDHEDLEVLLESFSKQVEEIVNEAENIEVKSFKLSSDIHCFNRSSRLTSNRHKR
jgi:multimeric flavodoxin WrbA